MDVWEQASQITLGDLNERQKEAFLRLLSGALKDLKDKEPRRYYVRSRVEGADSEYVGAFPSKEAAHSWIISQRRRIKARGNRQLCFDDSVGWTDKKVSFRTVARKYEPKKLLEVW